MIPARNPESRAGQCGSSSSNSRTTSRRGSIHPAHAASAAAESPAPAAMHGARETPHRAGFDLRAVGMPRGRRSRRVDKAAPRPARTRRPRAAAGPRQLGRQSAVDGVARAGGVDDVDRGRRQALDRPARFEQQRAVAAERDQDRRARVGDQARGGLRRIGRSP